MVKVVVKKLNYVLDVRVVFMWLGVNYEIGLFIYKIVNCFNVEIISGVSDLLEDEGYFLLVFDVCDDVVC